MKNIEAMPVEIIQPFVIEVRPSKTAQNRAECLSDAQKVKVYRKDCEGCLYANEAVCCGGVR